MTTADAILADLDRHIRAAKTAQPAKSKPASSSAQPAKSKPAPGAVPSPPSPDELEAMKEEILATVRQELEWDGTGAGDPNDSLAALETALADMFDADVEITWDGESKLLMSVDGEEPTHLTVDYLGELLEALARQGGDDAGSDDEVEGDAGRLPTGGMRGAVVDKQGHHHAADGENGGQFVSKGGAAVSAAKAGAKAVGKAAKAGADPGGSNSGGGNKAGSSAGDLAKRAGGRAGPRATAKAIDETFSKSTGQRVRVSANKDGSFSVGKSKKKMSGKKIAALMIASWLAFGVAGGLLSTLIGPVGLFGALFAEYMVMMKLLSMQEQ